MNTYVMLWWEGCVLWQLSAGSYAFYASVFITPALLVFHYMLFRRTLEGGLSMLGHTQSYEPRPAPCDSRPTRNATDELLLPLTPEEKAWVGSIRALIEKHLDDAGFDVKKLCREIGMSNSQLHRKLRAATGHSANRFIRHIRLLHAQHLLRDTERTIAAIADDCGFNDAVYFARVFKQTFGMQPSAWRKKQAQQRLLP